MVTFIWQAEETSMVNSLDKNHTPVEEKGIILPLAIPPTTSGPSHKKSTTGGTGSMVAAGTVTWPAVPGSPEHAADLLVWDLGM